MSTRQAVCIGINYAGTDHALRGCINDADDWAKLLGANGFNVSILAEKAATRAAILDSVRRIVAGLKPDDVGCVTYSGHGTWLPDTSGDEPDRRDEALCPVDMGEDGANLLLDDTLAVVFDKIPAGSHLVFVTDCCHSGTVYRMATPGHAAGGYRRPRFLPPSHFLGDAAVKAQMDRAFGQPAVKKTVSPNLIHYSGCKDTEYSIDAEVAGRPCGAFSHYAIPAFARAVVEGASYGAVFKEIRQSLPSWEFQQTPQFNTTAANKKVKVFG